MVAAGRTAKRKIQKFGQTKAGKVLKKVGQVATFVAPVPGGKIAGVVKGVKAAKRLVQAGKAARKARKVASVAKKAKSSKVGEIRRLGSIAQKKLKNDAIKRNRRIRKDAIDVASGANDAREIRNDVREFRR